MHGENEFLELLKPHPPRAASAPGLAKEKRPESDEDSCRAFGYLRGLQDKALAVEFRLRSGDREWYPYSWLGPWRFNPSVGLLLKFTGDLVTLVLIRGSNLDMQVGETGVNLTEGGLQRHRILWVREMDEDELHEVREGGPTIDSIEIAEFENQEQMQEWIKNTAPAFMRK
jgi:hypothetical protein